MWYSGWMRMLRRSKDFDLLINCMQLIECPIGRYTRLCIEQTIQNRQYGYTVCPSCGNGQYHLGGGRKKLVFFPFVYLNRFQMQRQLWNVKNVRTNTATKTRFYGRPPTIAATMAAPLVNCPKMLSHVLPVGLA